MISMISFLFRFTADLVISFNEGRAKALKGKVKGAVLRGVEDLCEEKGIKKCEIHLSHGNLSIYGVPENLHQRFRNVVMGL